MSNNLQQWEYKTIPIRTNDETLNALGEQGWEVATVKDSIQGHNESLLLKRPTSAAQKMAQQKAFWDEADRLCSGR